MRLRSRTLYIGGIALLRLWLATLTLTLMITASGNQSSTGDLVKPDVVRAEDVRNEKDTKVIRVGNLKSHYVLLCSTSQTTCVTPDRSLDYFLYDKNTRWQLPNATQKSTLAFFEDFYGSYTQGETVAMFPASGLKSGNVGIYWVDSKNAIEDVRYQSIKALWNDLSFNQIKRKKLLSTDHPVLVVVLPLKVCMVLAAKAGTVGTVVVADDEENLSTIAYVNIPAEMEDGSLALESLQRGDTVTAIGVISSVKPKGAGAGKNPNFNAIHIMFGRVTKKG